MRPVDPFLPSAEAHCAALVARRARVAAAWAQDDGLGDGLVVVPAGLPIPIEGTDQPYGFRAHDDHTWLAGARAPRQVLVHDPASEHAWTLFAYEADQDDRVWHGDTESIDDQAARLGIERVLPLAEFGPWLGDRAGRPAALLGNTDILEIPSGYELHPQQLGVLAFEAELNARVQLRVEHGRRVKDDVELAFMRAAAAATHAGHMEGMRGAQAGWTERALQVEIEYAFERAGAERPAYSSIAAAASNAAVLHASPGSRALAAGDLVLVDAGAEVEGYDCDVTRTWPVSPSFSAEQRDLYDMLLAVQERAITGVQAGNEYKDLHMEASRGIAQGLVDFGLLKGKADDLVDQDAHALFFPHGLGHLIGLGTHDVGGWPADRERSDRPGLKYLRIDITLEPGNVVTIEPGVYFVRALLEDPELRHKHHDHVDWARVDGMLDFGGFRIEDDVLVTAGGPDVLTADIPKARADVEALRG